MLTKLSLSIVALLFSQLLISQSISHVEPPNWWTDMQHNSIQIMIHGDSIGRYDQVNIEHSSVTVDQVTKADSPNYLFVDITLNKLIAATTLPIILSNGSNTITHDYPILTNNPASIDFLNFDTQFSKSDLPNNFFSKR